MSAVGTNTGTGVGAPDKNDHTILYSILYASFIHFIIFKFLHFLHKSCLLTHLPHQLFVFILFPLCNSICYNHLHYIHVSLVSPPAHFQLDPGLSADSSGQSEVLRGQDCVSERKGGAEGSGWRGAGLFS